MADPTDLSELAGDDFAYLTTTGRKSGEPHTIEIWFGVDRGVVYVMGGGREQSDWTQNLLADPNVRIRIREDEWDAVARVVEPETDEDARVRELLREKYANADDDLVSWARRALPVAFERRT